MLRNILGHERKKVTGG